MMKTCCTCGQDVPLEDFPPNRARGDGRQAMCRPCYAAYQRDYHRRRIEEDEEFRHRTRSARKERTMRIRRHNHQQLLAYFEAHPCADCGEGDHIVLTFDHVRGEKRFAIANRLHSMRWPRLLEEIAKCEVVCANCHMRRTAQRAGYYLDLA